MKFKLRAMQDQCEIRSKVDMSGIIQLAPPWRWRSRTADLCSIICRSYH